MTKIIFFDTFFLYILFLASGGGSPLYPEILQYNTMILQRIRIIAVDAGFEPGTFCTFSCKSFKKPSDSFIPAMWANRSGHLPKISQVSELLMLFTKNEQIAHFSANCSFAHFFAKKRAIRSENRWANSEIPNPAFGAGKKKYKYPSCFRKQLYSCASQNQYFIDFCKLFNNNGCYEHFCLV